MVSLRTQMKSEISGIMKERDDIRKKVNAKREKEKTLIELCKQEKPVYEDVEKVLKEVNENAS